MWYIIYDYILYGMQYLNMSDLLDICLLLTPQKKSWNIQRLNDTSNNDHVTPDSW